MYMYECQITESIQLLNSVLFGDNNLKSVVSYFTK